MRRLSVSPARGLYCPLASLVIRMMDPPVLYSISPSVCRFVASSGTLNPSTAANDVGAGGVTRLAGVPGDAVRNGNDTYSWLTQRAPSESLFALSGRNDV